MEGKISELERNNKTAMTAHIIEVIIMTLFSILQLTGGLRNGVLFIFDLLLGFGPIVAEVYFWKKNHETEMIKHLVAMGFAAYYAYMLFTNNNNLTFTFVIPMILVVTIYNDSKYFLKINCGTVILSIILIALGAKTGKFGYEGMEDAISQLTVLILVAVFSIYSAKTSHANNSQRIEEAQEAQRKSEELLKRVEQLSGKMHDGIKNIYGDLEQLNSASKATKNAMAQLSTGATETAEAVQKQTYQTEKIQNKINLVTDATDNITESMQQTLQVLEKGKTDVDLLVSQVEISVNNGAQVAEKLEKLDSYVEEMHGIVKMIGSIASQTSMLALNASIEAARAGEAGRGFAVVASQVTTMAAQTKDATVHITELIDNVSSAIEEVVTVIHQMLDGINEEKQSTTNTAGSFENIQENTQAIRGNVEKLVQGMVELKTANQEIVDSIQTISAISQEVSAHANQTAAAEETNAGIIENMDFRMHDLIMYITDQQKFKKK